MGALTVVDYKVTLRDSGSVRYVSADYFTHGDYFGAVNGGLWFWVAEADPNAPVKFLPVAFFQHGTEVELGSPPVVIEER